MKPSPPEDELQGSTSSAWGCLRAALAAPILVALSPLVAVLRWWAARRRGQQVLVRRPAREKGTGAVDGRYSELVFEVDAPRSRVAQTRVQLTDLLVRVAEALTTPEHVNHMIYREAAEPESVVLPLGPGIQAFAERLTVTLGRESLHGRTLLWLVLPRHLPVSHVLDPRSYDPDGDGAVAGVMENEGVSHAVTLSYRRTGPSTLFRCALWVPEPAAARVEALVDRFSERVSRTIV